LDLKELLIILSYKNIMDNIKSFKIQ